jgi:hypothetical protein
MPRWSRLLTKQDAYCSRKKIGLRSIRTVSNLIMAEKEATTIRAKGKHLINLMVVPQATPVA